MPFRKYLFVAGAILLFVAESCTVTKNYNPDKKYSSEALKSDYELLRKILEQKHPALYWYTPKDSMDHYFDGQIKNIKDSMTELQFGWSVIAPTLNQIHCGHTSFSMSSNWYRFLRNKQIPSFPLYLKVWDDSMIVAGNLNKKDSIFKRGTIIKSINGVPNKELMDFMFHFLPQDGYENSINYLRLSTAFPYYHRNIFGIYQNYSVEYINDAGVVEKTLLKYYNPLADSVKKGKDSLLKLPEPKEHVQKINHRKKLERLRSLQINQKENYAVLSLYTFSKAHLKSFFRRSFKTISSYHINHLVLDIRGNGGGDISNYVALTKYIRNTPFKVSDTTYAISKTLAPYTKYIKNGFLTNLGLKFLTAKRNHVYHFNYWERHLFDPRHLNHFNGKVYVLTNGFTFSASSLFCNAVKGQSNVKLVGENTGGGWYGNSGIFIPEIILPNTKLKIRLPLFRIIQSNHVAFKGTGVFPDIRVDPTRNAVIENKDLKMDLVKALIKSDSTNR